MVWDSVDMKSYKSSSTIPILFVGQPHINNSDTFCWTTTQCSILWLWIRSTAVPGGGGGGGGGGGDRLRRMGHNNNNTFYSYWPALYLKPRHWPNIWVYRLVIVQYGNDAH